MSLFLTWHFLRTRCFASIFWGGRAWKHVLSKEGKSHLVSERESGQRQENVVGRNVDP